MRGLEATSSSLSTVNSGSALRTFASRLRFSAVRASVTMRGLDLYFRGRKISSATPPTTAAAATSWEARRPSDGTSSRLSVRRDSIQKRPAPYQTR